MPEHKSPDAHSPSHRNPPHSPVIGGGGVKSPAGPSSNESIEVKSLRTALRDTQARITAMEAAAQQQADALRKAGDMLEIAERAATDAEAASNTHNPYPQPR